MGGQGNKPLRRALRRLYTASLDYYHYVGESDRAVLMALQEAYNIVWPPRLPNKFHFRHEQLRKSLKRLHDAAAEYLGRNRKEPVHPIQHELELAMREAAKVLEQFR